MMAVEVHSQPESNLDGVLRHHLRLEPEEKAKDEAGDLPIELSKDAPPGETDVLTIELGKSKGNHKRSVSQPPMKFALQVSRPAVNKSTIESDNKRRLGIIKKNATRYEPPPPDPPDPNSEAKTVTINRMQSNLQEWDKQIKDILEKKAKNDTLCTSELANRDQKIKELSESYSSEHKIRTKTEKQRDKLTTKLKHTEDDLLEHRQQVDQLQNELAEYQAAYQESEAQRATLEDEFRATAEQLQNSEGMRKRLYDQVTELQGQLAIEEQRSKFCIIL